MKRVILWILFYLFVMLNCFSQELSFKYGKISADELSMKKYSKDSTANAVVIYDDGYSEYEIINGRFLLVSNYKKKIKILKQEGVDEANIVIPYYYKNYNESETISNLEAIAYNLEGGKVVKSKLESKYIVDEELGSNYRRKKFSIPGVKVGTVIELKFKRSSTYIYGIDTWGIQSDIPVIFSSYELVIPEYFKFNFEIKGFENVDVSDTPVNKSFTINNSGTTNTVNCTARNLKFIANAVPALKDENYVWCINDFLSSVRFELKATQFPGEFYKPYSQSWDDLERVIKDETDFGTNIKMSNPFKDELETLLANVTDDKVKIEKIYSFLKDNIRWNEKYSFNGNKYRDAVKDKTGDNGQMNMILMSMLRNADIVTYPILISRRSQGRLRYTYPSYNQLNTFVVAAETSDGQVYYMDGSALHGGLNMLPTELMVDRGRVFESSHAEKWVDLSNLTKNKEISMINAKLDANGKLTGSVDKKYINQCAYAFKENYQAAKDSTEFIEKLSNNFHVSVDSFSVVGNTPMLNVVSERLNFSKDIEIAGDYIYMNPMIFTHLTENKFTQTDRKLPIEFNSTISYFVSCSITLPKEYAVVEIPKSVRVSLNENCKFQYIIQQDDDKITLNYRFDMLQTVFLSSDYTLIRAFFGQLVTKNSEMIVLKKI